MAIDIKTASILVPDQSKALAFSTDILGFQKINDIDLGEFAWFMVSSPGSGKTEFPLHFSTADIQEEDKRLKKVESG